MVILEHGEDDVDAPVLAHAVLTFSGEEHSFLQTGTLSNSHTTKSQAFSLL